MHCTTATWSGSLDSVDTKHLREWLFHSRTGVGVGVRNSSRVGVGTGVGPNNLSGVDLRVEFYCLNFALALASKTLVYKVIYRTDVYEMYIYEEIIFLVLYAF
jgi:hypothetical protein